MKPDSRNFQSNFSGFMKLVFTKPTIRAKIFHQYGQNHIIILKEWNPGVSGVNAVAVLDVEIAIL